MDGNSGVTSADVALRVLTCALTVLLLSAAAGAKDTDGDGLTDFREIHKHFTDPARADTDEDGIPDGDWRERREYAYTVRSIVQVMRPAEAITDDYQDARVLDETDEYVEIEVIHYPLNTVAEAISGSREWGRAADRPEEYLASTTTANWDDEMRTRLLAELREKGIEPGALDDRAFVEQTAAYLMKRSRGNPDFTTFFTRFVDGEPELAPGFEKAADHYDREGLSLEERWRRDLFAKGMFETRMHGSCTSSSIYLQGCLRAVGVPTRTILCIPVVDASDPREMEMVKRLRHHRARRTILDALSAAGNAWTSHTFNEVWVGGRWRRLNYQRLGQNILDPHCLGLMTHVLTLRDWADADEPATVGRRQALGRYDDVFGHRNPYSAITVSDRFGAHARIENEPLPAFRRLTIGRAVWYDSPDRPEELSLQFSDTESGHALLKVKENRPDGGLDQYREFWDTVDRRFVLRAAEGPEVRADAVRGYWASGWFTLRIEPAELSKMPFGVPYRLVPLGEGECRWTVEEGVTLTRRKIDELRRMTLDALMWTDSADAPDLVRQSGVGLGLLARVVEWEGWEKMKRFTARADRVFFLEAEGRPPIEVACGVGGVTGPDTRYVVLHMGDADRARLAKDVPYRLRARNGKPGYRWIVEEGLMVTRGR